MIDLRFVVDVDSSCIVNRVLLGFPVEPVDISTAVANADISITMMGRPITEDPVACSHIGAAAAWLGNLAS